MTSDIDSTLARQMGGMPIYMGAPVQQGMGGSEASSPQRFARGGGKYGSYGAGRQQQSADASPMMGNFYPSGRRSSASASFAAYPAYSPPMGVPMTAYSPSWYTSALIARITW
jgi:hypothetical protein